MHVARTPSRRPCIGLVAPALEHAGGVSTVAEFVSETIERSGVFDLEIVSLPSSARDPLGVGFTRPASWFRGVQTAEGVWHGRPFVSVGAFGTELEFQRYRPRPALARALARCDLVQVVTGQPSSAHAVCGLGKPVAVFCATLASVERRARHAANRGAAEVWRRWMTRLIDRLDRRTLREVDAIQAMNPWLADRAREINAGRDKPIVLLRPGVDTAVFAPGAGADRLAQPYILCVGRLDDPRKNLTVLLHAYAALALRMAEPPRLVLAGFSGPDERFWLGVDRFGLRDRVTFVRAPSREALVALYQSASVLALSSDEEGLGMVVLEAMSCGVPVVSTSSGGPDSVIRDGVDGFLVPLRDAAALSDRLERLLTERPLNTAMGLEARRAVLARFDSIHAGQALLDTYDDLLSRAHARATVTVQP